MFNATPKWGPIEGCLLLRYQYVLLAYSMRPDESVSLPVAVACVTPDDTMANFALFIKSDWERHVSEKHLEYLKAIFEEWANVTESDPATVLRPMLELSVGPLRTIEDGECDQEELTSHIEAFLTGPYRRFVSP